MNDWIGKEADEVSQALAHFQADIREKRRRNGQEKKFITGIFLFRVDFSFDDVARSANEHGVLSEAERPKIDFQVYRAFYAEKG
jgi:hypothetical protein